MFYTLLDDAGMVPTEATYLNAQLNCFYLRTGESYDEVLLTAQMATPFLSWDDTVYLLDSTITAYCPEVRGGIEYT